MACVEVTSTGSVEGLSVLRSRVTASRFQDVGRVVPLIYMGMRFSFG